MMDVLEVSIEMVTVARPAIERIDVADADLGRQLRRALNSIALNVAEGVNRHGRDRKQHLRIAHGSAGEVTAGFRLATIWGYVAERDLADTLALLDRVNAMLFKMTR
jgi:four helix bundle protein